MIQLHCFGESGHSYKVALALELSGIEWEPVFLDFFNADARAEFRKNINVMGEAPVLVDGDVTLSQSGVIQGHISEKSGKFGGSSPEEAREILRWVLWDNHKLSGQIGLLRFLMNFLSAEKRPAEVVKFTQGRLKAAYQTLEKHLTQRDWIVGRSVTNADLTCCGYLYYQEPFGFDRADWPAIDGWLDRIAALDGWKHPYDLMQRAWHSAGSDGN